MATKPTKNKAITPKATKPAKPKADKAAPIQYDPQPGPVFERDAFGVSFCIIARPEDLKSLNRCMASLPADAQVCILLNEPHNGESEITELDVAVHPKRTVRSRLWKYPHGQFSFSAARNMCHAMATCEWIFWIDCDEMLAHAQHDGIRYAAMGHGAGVGGFHAAQAHMTRYPQMLGGECEYASVKQLRLYRNAPGLRWEGYAHEQIAHTVRGAGYSIVDTSLVVIHNGYSEDDGALIQKLRRNADLIGRWLADHKTHELRTFYEDLYVRELSSLRQLESKHGKV
jgi:hypothetical protein